MEILKYLEHLQDFVTSKYIITEKQAHSGMNKHVKGRIVSWGFQEDLGVQSDSAITSNDSLNMILILVANCKHELLSIDINGIFLQGEKLDRK